MLQFPNIDPEIVSLGPLSIRWYGVSYVVGILIGWYYVERRSDGQKGWLPISVTREIESNHIRARNFKQRHAFLKLLSTQVGTLGGDESQA